MTIGTHLTVICVAQMVQLYREFVIGAVVTDTYTITETNCPILLLVFHGS